MQDTLAITDSSISSVARSQNKSRFVNVRDLNDFDIAKCSYRDDADDIDECILRHSNSRLLRCSMYGTRNLLDAFHRRIKLLLVRKSFLVKYHLSGDLRIRDDSTRKLLDEVTMCVVDAWNRYFKSNRLSINW